MSSRAHRSGCYVRVTSLFRTVLPMLRQVPAFPKKPVARESPLAYRQRSFGAVAQLGERVVRNDEVRGSIPLGSTNFPKTCGFLPIGGNLRLFLPLCYTNV